MRTEEWLKCSGKIPSLRCRAKSSRCQKAKSCLPSIQALFRLLLKDRAASRDCPFRFGGHFGRGNSPSPYESMSVFGRQTELAVLAAFDPLAVLPSSQVVGLFQPPSRGLAQDRQKPTQGQCGGLGGGIMKNAATPRVPPLPVGARRRAGRTRIPRRGC
jgi:hypothetical protein